MKICDCMKRNVISSKPDLIIYEAAKLLVFHHIGCLPIVNDKSELIGLVRIRDLITLAMPDFVHLIENVDFVHDFGAVEDDIPDNNVLKMPIGSIMGDPVAVEESAGLVRVIALMQEHALNDMPVVDENHHLVGIASYVDIGVALLSNWKTN